MPIATSSQIQNAILAITNPPSNSGFPTTQSDAVNKWADVADLLLSGVIPPSSTSSAGRSAFIGVLSAATNANPIAPVLLDGAFMAYAGALAGGMAPAFTGVPPVTPPGLAAILVVPVSDAVVVATTISTTLTIWAKTGSATMNATPFTVLLWL